MSIQQRLLHREPLDPWSIRERLCLASAVCRSGDQNWMSVSRALRAAGDPTRPQDWYQQKYCAAQYGALLESAETPKRKKRTSEGAAETPQEAILKRLTAERIAELQKLMQDYKNQYAVIKDEVSEIRSTSTSDARLRELTAGAEAARRAREREQQRQATWLRDREQRRRSGDKSRRVSLGAAAGTGVSPPASSPLLSSLLNSTSPSAGVSVTQMLHIPHPSHIQDTTSPSASAPTLSQLLEKGRAPVAVVPAAISAPPSSSDAAVIEQIKSELQEIENSLRLGNMPPSTQPVMSLPPERSLDIDDIEIKAEDVYAFSDMDLEIQPVSTIHKNIPRSIDKAPESARDASEPTHVSEEAVDIGPPSLEIKNELIEQAVLDEDFGENRPAQELASALELPQSVPLESTVTEEEESPKKVDVGPEAAKEATPAPEQDERPGENVTQREQTETRDDQSVVAEETATPSILESSKPEDEEEELNVTAVSDANEEAIGGDQQTGSSDAAAQSGDQSIEIKEEAATLEEQPVDTVQQDSEPDREEPEELLDTGGSVILAEPDAKPSDAETHTETDDDTPMQVIREEEKLGRKRRDYSRRKTQILSESRGASGSESAAESAPASPRTAPTPEPDKDHKLWKKSVMLVYNRLCAHKYASLFLRPITDDVAPDYSLVIKRPMDLTTIKRNIDSGVIRTTTEFQRDVLLMLSNALFYNSSRHRVHHMAQEMHREAVAQFGMLLQAQARAALPEPPTRRPHPHPHTHPAKRKRLSSPAAASPHKRLKEEPS